MPKTKEHLRKATDNESFADSLDLKVPVNVDWAITALFYAALHYVEAYFAIRNFHSPDHRTRDSAIHRDQGVKVIFDDYSELKNYSINARYYIWRHPPPAVANLKANLSKIKQQVTTLIR